MNIEFTGMSCEACGSVRSRSWQAGGGVVTTMYVKSMLDQAIK